MWTFSQPTLLMSRAVAHMQMHQLSPGFGSLLIVESHWNAFWPVISQKSPSGPHPRGSEVSLSKSLAHTRCVESWLHL